MFDISVDLHKSAKFSTRIYIFNYYCKDFSKNFQIAKYNTSKMYNPQAIVLAENSLKVYTSTSIRTYMYIHVHVCTPISSTTGICL